MRQTTDALGGVTRQDYDALGRLTTVTRKSVTRTTLTGTTTTSTTADLTDSFTYDETGQRIRTVDALNQASTADYDAMGRIVRTVTAAGATTTYAYTLKQASDNAILAMDGAVSAATAGSATLTAATYSGGYKVTTTQADGRTLVDERDYFGHTTRHTDLSGAVFTYSFNSAGQLAKETSTVHAGQTAGKNVSYGYYANGYIQSVKDTTLGTSAEYAYDNAGNRTYEAYFKLDSAGGKTGSGAQAYQNSTITYDELNRISRVQDENLYDIRYEYDAMGNRRLVDSVYKDDAAGLRGRQTYWYAYDALNRFTLTKGRLSTTSTDTSDLNRFATARRGTSATDTSVKIEAGTEGTLVGYDKLSRRASAEYTFNGQAIKEVYGYSTDGYLQTTTQGTTLVSVRTLDALGRTVKSKDLTNNQETQTDYDADSRLTQQRFFDGKDSTKNYTLDYSYYDSTANSTASVTGRGALAKTVLKPANSATDSSTYTTTTYSYDYWDGALQKLITKTASVGSGTISLTYDANGHIQRSYDSVSYVDNRYVTTATGLVLQRDRSGAGASHHYFYYADDNRIGDVSDTPEDIQRVSYAEQLAQKTSENKRQYYRNIRNSRLKDREDWYGGVYGQDWGKEELRGSTVLPTADFDQNYEPINDNYPSQAATAYTVRSSAETLYSIAQSVWGDRSMWYLIAEANGLKATSTLKAGQIVQVPNKVTNIHNNSQTWRPYNPGEAMGRTDPTVPTPPPPANKGCGGAGTLIMAVVAVAATIYTAGAAAAYFSGGTLAGGFAGGVAVVSGSAGLSLAAVGAAAVGAAAGSIASQAVGMAIGEVDSFSWRAVGQAAIGGAVTAGVGSALNNAQLLGQSTGAWGAAGRAAIGTGANLALHNDWSWRNVMISAASAGVGATVGSAVGDQAWAQAGNGFGQRMASRLAGALAARALTGGNRGSYETVFASTLASAIGESLAQPSYKTLLDTGTPIQRIRAEDIGKLPQLDVPELNLGPLPQVNLAPSAEELQADFRASERAYRQATETGAVIQPGDTLERLTNGDKALMGRYAAGMGLRSMNDLRVGQSMVANWDMSDSDAMASATSFYAEDGRNKALAVAQKAFGEMRVGPTIERARAVGIYSGDAEAFAAAAANRARLDSGPQMSAITPEMVAAARAREVRRESLLNFLSGQGNLALGGVAAASVMIGTQDVVLASQATNALGPIDNLMAPMGGGAARTALSSRVRTPANGLPSIRLGELSQEGHALARHGGWVTDEQLMIRAYTGVAPDGSFVGRNGQVQIPSSSTAFYTDKALAEADLFVRQKYLDQAVALGVPGAQRLTIEGVDVGAAVGRGYDRVTLTPGGAGPLQYFENLSRVTGVYDYHAQSGTWKTVTIYPVKR